MLSKQCPKCGNTFYKPPSRSLNYWNKRSFCSRSCASSRPNPSKGKSLPHLWKKNESYSALHGRVYRKHGKPQKCIHCGSTKKVQWANKSNKYIDVDDFISLCHSCHRKYDNKMNGIVPWNKGLTGKELKKHYPNGMKGAPKGVPSWNKYLKPKKCLQCKELFQPRSKYKKYCSNKCYRNSPAQKLGAEGRKLKGRWSLKHEKCVVCETVDRRHQAKGFCTKCYLAGYYQRS